MLLSEYIKNRRIEKGFTQRTLAKEIGVTPVFISNIERNVAVPKSGKALKNLSCFFQIPFSTLQEMALGSIALLRIQNSKNDGVYQYQLALARMLITSALAQNELAEIEKIIRRGKFPSMS